MNLLSQKNAQIREKRLDNLSAYIGKVDDILIEFENDNIKQRIRTFSQNAFDEIVIALKVISNIKDSIVVIHGATGCNAAELYFFSEQEKNRWFTSNLDENDSIMGGESKLRETIIKAYKRYKPKVIFIVATPIVAINNDDIQSVIFELKNKLSSKLVPILTDGFKSKSAVNGYDVIGHAVGKYLIDEKEIDIKDDFINLISVSENLQNIKEILRILNIAGIKVNLLPRFSDIDNITRVLKAKFTIAVNYDEGNYLGEVLEKNFNVPFIKTLIPIGTKRTIEWLKDVTYRFCNENNIDKVIFDEISNIKTFIDKKILKDKRVYISLQVLEAIGILDLVEELGGEVIGLSVNYIDKLNKQELQYINKKGDDFIFHVGNGQSFEEANILKKLQPDLYIGEKGNTIWAAKQGITAIAINNIETYGFKGILSFINVVQKALKNNSMYSELEKEENSPYIYAWLNKSPNWYIKQEVK